MTLFHSISKKRLPWLFILTVLFIAQGCKSKKDANDYYAEADFSKIRKIDVHAHQLTARKGFVEQAIADNFTLISLNSEVPDYPSLDSQQNFIWQLRQSYKNDLFYVSAFKTANINQPGWSEEQLKALQKSFDSGAIGIKVWKNIGMTIKDKDGSFVMIDNPVFEPIFNYLEKKGIPVIGHIGEPKNCWLPLDQMTTNNDRAYFTAHPEYHMYLHPEYPSYDTIIRSRDRLLEKHPDLKFVGAHLGSMEWDVDEIAKRLDKFPNLYVEPAERFGQLQFQSITDWQKVRDFFIKYQDRIMYGTDLEDNLMMMPGEIAKHAHELWMRDWRYLTTGDTLQSAFVNEKFKGLQLPKSVVDKIYYSNAKRCYFSKLKNF